MKNATKLVWLLMLFASSIVFAFGQTGANKMTTEQKIAYDNSIVSKGTVVENFAAPTGNRNSKAVLLDEDFGSGIPAGWSQIVYGGVGVWEWSGTIGPSYGQPPNSDGLYATADSDAHNGWTFNVGLFTPSMNMTGSNIVEIDLDRNFQAFTGDVARIRVYSGGTAPGNLEITLFQSLGVDDPYAGVHSSYVIDPTGFADPTDVYLEFFYSTGGTWQWNFAIDNLYVNLIAAPGDMYGYVFNGGGLTIAGATVGIPSEGVLTTTAPNGYYELLAVPGGTVLAYATKQGYNTIEKTVVIPAGGTVQQDFILTAPTMIISPTFHTYTLNPEEYFTTSTGILNTGDGPLNWLAGVVYPITDSDGHGLSKIISIDEPGVANNGPLTYEMPQGNASIEGQGGTSSRAFELCPADAIFANEPTPVTGSWSGNTSTEDAGYKVYQSFSGLTENIGSATFYGFSLACCWSGCSDPTKEFLVEFWEAGSVPGASVAAYTIEAATVSTGEIASGYEVFKWDIAFPGVNLADGWISIQETNTYGQTCWFLWYNSTSGTGNAVQWSGSAYTVMTAPQAICLGAGGGAGSWLTLDYYENTVAPLGGLDNVPTNFDASGTSAGEVYTADLVFTSVDPHVGTITIPCTMIIAGDPLVAPTDLIVELIDDLIGTVELTWTWTTDAFQFFIVKRDGVPIGTSTTTSYIDTPLPDYGTYCYTVQSFYDEGYSVPTDEVCVEWPLPEIFVNPTYHYAEVWVDHQHIWTTKISNTGIGTLAYNIPPVGSCEHEVVMYDQFGDGWNGGTLTVYVDGDVVLNAITMAGSGPVYDYFDAANGQTISSTFSCGSWCYECYYYIYDGFGNLVFSDGVGGVNPTGGSGPAACPGFIVDISPDHGYIGEGSFQNVQVTWDATGFPPGLYWQDFFVESNDPITPSVTVGNEMLVYVPAEYAGQVTECESGLPISGVTVTAGIWQTITDNGGNYSLFVDEGTYDVYFDKLGYNSYMEADTSAMAGDVTPLDVCLYEAPYSVPWVLATVNYPDEDFCDVEWSLPEGPYEIIYDDGEAEDLFVWSTSGNENAVRFTPSGYPAHVFGGRVYVGDGLWPAGNWLGSDFAIIVYANDGTDLPGTMLDSIGVTVNNYGWVEFTGLDATIESGDFYLSMYQLNYSPNAAPIGLDQTLPNVYRSYSRTVANSTWSLSIYQDFMMRAYVDGSQTDAVTDGTQMVYPPKVDREKALKHFQTANNSPFVGRPGTVKAGTTGNIDGYSNASEDVLYYTVARMSDFDPDFSPALGTMTILNNVTEFTYTDNDFAALPMGWYAYAVQVAYSSGMLSPWTYSNIVGRDMDAMVTFEVTLCDGTDPIDVEITMTGTEYPYEEYFGVTDATGIYTFDMVWKGKYVIDLYKIGYVNYNWEMIITQDETIPILMSEKMYPPRNLWVDPLTSYAYWDAPLVVALDEGFEGLTFPPTGWTSSTQSLGWFRTANGSSSAWTIPAWDSYYACANDDQAGSTANGSVDYLITPPLDLREVDTYRMMFDSYYDAYYGLQIATVEYSYDAGANWDVFYALAPMAGAWDYIDQDLSSFSGMTSTAPVWFAFHADDGGGWASGWAIDNVLFANGETEPVQYHVYLDGAFVATTDTTYYQYVYLQYGTTYTASVAAEYSCGLSDEIYYTFTSGFLLPPRNLDGLTFDHTVHVWWEPPVEPVTDFSENSSVFDPNFVAVTEEADYVGTTIDPVGYKSLSGTRAVLWDNGPLVNSPGTGAGGADESVLQAGLGTYGFGAQWPLGYLIADDFEVTGSAWTVNQITVYGYQTNSGPPSSFTGCYLQIFDGDPSAGGSVIWGDNVTNVLTATDWTGIYRVNAVGGGTARPIMYLTCATPGLSLPAGTYWLVYALDGSGTSGPWTPPVTIDGVLATGNALQFTTAWGAALDGSYQQDFPFLIEGTQGGGGGGGGIPDNFIGYNLYRDADNIAYIPYNGEDTTHYFDYNLEPLCYAYDVSAVYDLTPYGFPGETGESMWEGTFDVCVEYGWPLTFIEDWSTGSFDPNLWSHGENWVVNGQFGNPLPCAQFKWDPVIYDYRSSLESYPINGKTNPMTNEDYIDGRIFFDFDLSLVDNGSSGDEMLHVQVWDEGTWYTVASFSNDGGFGWTTEHFEISNHAFGKIFKVRFAAEGLNSSHILSWYVDNIKLYRQCDAPFDLYTDGVDTKSIALNWSPPAGGSPTGGEWIGWDDGVNVNGIGLTGGGVFSVASKWDPAMIAQYDGQYITKLQFIPYTNAVASTFTLMIWEGANAGTVIYSEAISGYVAGVWNEFTLTAPVAIDVTKELWFGYTVDSPDGENPAGNDDGPAVVGYGDMISLDGSAWDPISSLGPFDLNWNLKAYVGDADDDNSTPMTYVDNTVYRTPDATPVAGDVTVSVPMPEANSSRALLGYNVYWNDNGNGYNFLDFTEDTTYLHVVEADFAVGSVQCYYVTAVYEDCEPESNESCWIVTGIEDPALADGIAVYPNPARDILNITSSADITHVTVMNYVGQVVYNQKVVEDNDLQLNVAGYETGVYMVKVETTAGILIKKVTVAH